jgi:hypothetical protein
MRLANVITRVRIFYFRITILANLCFGIKDNKKVGEDGEGRAKGREQNSCSH